VLGVVPRYLCEMMPITNVPFLHSGEGNLGDGQSKPSQLSQGKLRWQTIHLWSLAYEIQEPGVGFTESYISFVRREAISSLLMDGRYSPYWLSEVTSNDPTLSE